MGSYFKKVISIMLAVFMGIGTTGIFVYADNAQAYSGESEIEVLTVESFEKFFGDSSATVEYSYSIGNTNNTNK